MYIKLDAIKHHHLVLRADEEIELLKTEMKATFSFYIRDWEQMSAVAKQLKGKPHTLYDSGSLCCLQLARLKCEHVLNSMAQTFRKFVDVDTSSRTDEFLSNSLHEQDRHTLQCCPNEIQPVNYTELNFFPAPDVHAPSEIFDSSEEDSESEEQDKKEKDETISTDSSGIDGISMQQHTIMVHNVLVCH